jgi:hypothetical protein
LPSLNGLTNQWYAMLRQHVSMCDVYKLQQLHGSNRWIASSPALVKDLLGNCTRISTHRFALLDEPAKSK